MSDLEERLSDALRQGADDAPPPVGLADGARRRARARRRHRVAAVGVVAVLAVGVPTGVVALRGSHSESPSTATTPPVPLAVPADPGYRWESWHGVSVQVPLSWGSGFLDQWCADGASPTPRVERTDEVSEAIGCSQPRESYGLVFSVAPKPGLNWPVVEQADDGFPPHTFVGTRDLAGVLIEVGTPSAALSQRILDSVVVDDRVLPDGCAATMSDESSGVGSAAMSVCEYDGDGMLSHSRQLSSADSAAAEAAVVQAPPLTQCPDPGSDPLVVLLSRHVNAVVDLQASCLYQPGDGSPRTVTDGVRTWATLPVVQ